MFAGMSASKRNAAMHQGSQDRCRSAGLGLRGRGSFGFRQLSPGIADVAQAPTGVFFEARAQKGAGLCGRLVEIRLFREHLCERVSSVVGFE
jgi:hypothetical protein